MRYWWVNQNQTFRHEVEGRYLWSPKTNKNGAANHFYDTMKEVAPGDLVFSFCDTYIKAVGVVLGTAQTSPKPDVFGTAGQNWSDEGWHVPVDFKLVPRPVRPKDLMVALQPTLPKKYSPLQANGNGNQAVYLAEVPASMAQVLLRALGPEVARLTEPIQADVVAEAADECGEAELLARSDLRETEKSQLVRARRGQGLFRSRVELIEPRCRLTGVADRSHLRASHIKPWRDSSDLEKLDGHNGLLLAPHIDHLFDRGFISFADTGDLLVSPCLASEVLAAWGIGRATSVGTFSSAQRQYLDYHRRHVFRS